MIINDNMTDEQKHKAVKEWLEVEENNAQIRVRMFRSDLAFSSVIGIVAGLISYFVYDATLIQACAMTIGTLIFLMYFRDDS